MKMLQIWAMICEPPSPAVLGSSNGTEERAAEDTLSVSWTRSKVFLQTTKTKAFPSDGGLFLVWFLLNAGSQISYLTNKLKHWLQLQPIWQKHLKLHTLGNDHFNGKEFDVVQVRILNRLRHWTSFAITQVVSLEHYTELRALWGNQHQ